MSSWSKQPIKIIQKPGYIQKTPAGIFDSKKTKPATVVSAYYAVQSRADQNTYKERMRLFLENLPVHLVFFCEEDLVPFVKTCRQHYEDRTMIIPLNRTEWNANIKYNDEAMWQSQLDKDPEKELHSVDLYKLWFEKKEFVITAIDINPFDHDDFIWMDAGIIREEALVKLIKTNFPVPSRIPNDRILLLNVKPFLAEDEIKSNGPSQITGKFERKDRIAAGIIAGNKEIWLTWSNIYDKTVDRYLEEGRFIGKEQSIMSTIVLENKNLVSLINPPKNFGQKWFYSLIYLGVSEKRYQVLNSYAKDTIESYQSISGIPSS
jgi:hypothetical protein